MPRSARRPVSPAAGPAPSVQEPRVWQGVVYQPCQGGAPAGPAAVSTSRARSRPIWSRTRSRGRPGRRTGSSAACSASGGRPRLHPRARRRGSAVRGRADRGRRPARLAPRRFGAGAPARLPLHPAPGARSRVGAPRDSCPMPEAFLPAALRGRPGTGPSRLAPSRDLRGSHARTPRARAGGAAGGDRRPRRRNRRREAPARPDPRDGARPPLHRRQHRATTSTGGGSASRPTSTPWPMPSRVSSTPRGAGESGTTPSTASRRWVELGRETWFRLGDRDLATHLHRTLLLRAGASLTAATRAITDALGVAARLVPMSDDPVRTELRTGSGWLEPGGVLRPRAVRARRPGGRVPGRRERPAGAPTSSRRSTRRRRSSSAARIP